MNDETNRLTVGSDIWREVLREAIERAAVQDGGPVPGARLRTYVSLAAAEKGLSLPADTKFVEFLSSFPDVVVLLRRSGQDILVAPADRPALFAEEDHNLVVRQDLFDAVTRIREGARAWYATKQDAVIWLPPEIQSPQAGLVAMPAASLEHEIQLRRNFALHLPDELQIARERLLAALDEPRALSAFAKEIKAVSLAGRWHVERSKAVVRQLRDWSREVGVTWGANWLVHSTRTSAGEERSFAEVPSSVRLTESVAGALARLRLARAEATVQRVSSSAASSADPAARRAVLSMLLERLDDADLARISVPMDLIAKAFAQSQSSH